MAPGIKSVLFTVLTLCYLNTYAQISALTLADPSPERIMKLFYKNYNAKEKTAYWVCYNKGMLGKFELIGSAKFQSKLLFVDSVNTSGSLKQLYIFTESRPNADNADCHSCAPVEEVFIFNRTNLGWKGSYHKIFDNIGSFGESQSFELKKLGKDTYGFMTTPGYTAQGITTVSVVIYSYYRGNFQQILFIDSAFMDNSGDCDPKIPGSCWGYDYQLNFLAGDIAYNDIVFTQKGTQEVNEKVQKFAKTIRYHFDGASYVAVK